MSMAADEVLHTASGLQQLMGDRALYLQILGRFSQRYRAAAGQAQASLAAGDRPAAIRIVHTLKGAAGMIGARQVYRLASEQEAAACALPLAPLAQAMEALMAQIDLQLDIQLEAGGGNGTAAPAAAPPADARLLLQQLARLLEEGDGAAIDVLEQSATVLAASLGVELFEQVTAAAHQFDFDTALARLREGAA